MNANARSISVIALVFTFLLPWCNMLQGQVLIDPRDEDAEMRGSAERSTAESTSTESTASQSAVSDGATAHAATVDRAGRESVRTEGARRERPLTGRRTLPPPQAPDEQVPADRRPPPRPSDSLRAEPEREAVVEQPRGTGRPYLGITFDPTVRDSAVVGAIVPDSPAEQAGLQPGDEIVAINDQPVGSIEEAFAVVGRLRPGEIINIEFSRRISTRTQAMLEDAPDDAIADRELDTLPERRSTSYREPPRSDYEIPNPAQRESRQDRIRILRRYGEDQSRSNSDDDERRELDRRELEEWLRDRQRAPDRPLRNRPFLRWWRG